MGISVRMDAQDPEEDLEEAGVTNVYMETCLWMRFICKLLHDLWLNILNIL